MRKCNGIALWTMLLCMLAAPALAATSAGLATGGRTLAGPGKLSLALNEAVTIYADADGNSRLCGTLVNSSKDSTVRLTLNAVNADVLAGDSSALCRNNVTSATVTCLGPSGCTAEWRLDDQ
jgi:hypothetical protein